MRTVTVLIAAILVVSWFLTAGLETAEAEVRYMVTDLGNLGGGAMVWPNAINYNRQIVGSATVDSGTSHAFYWSSGVISDLGTFGYDSCWGLDINQGRDIVGAVLEPGFVPHAYIYENSTTFTLIGDFGGPTSMANGCNKFGVAVGRADTSETDTSGYIERAFKWDNGSLTDLGTLGGPESVAYAINNGGGIAGVADTDEQNSSGNYIEHAAFWKSDTVTDLETLGGEWSTAYDLNYYEIIVGISETTGGNTHGFVWDAGTMTDLGTLGGDESWASAINNSSQIVGDADIPGGDNHAFLWEDGTMTDLNDLIPSNSGWVLEKASDINNSAEIIGWGSRGGGNLHGFLLRPLELEVIGLSGSIFHLGWSVPAEYELQFAATPAFDPILDVVYISVGTTDYYYDIGSVETGFFRLMPRSAMAITTSSK